MKKSPHEIVQRTCGRDTVSGDQIIIKDYLYGEACRIERVEFVDGTVWDAAYLRGRAAALLPVATEGDDNLVGGLELNVYLKGLGGNDTLRGTMGSDRLAGNAGGTSLAWMKREATNDEASHAWRVAA